MNGTEREMKDVSRIAQSVEKLERTQNSTSARVWDVASKLSVAAVIAVFTWVVSNSSRLDRIEETRFTEQDALRMQQNFLTQINALSLRIGDIPMRVRDEVQQWSSANFPPAWLQQAVQRIEKKVDALDQRMDAFERGR